MKCSNHNYCDECQQGFTVIKIKIKKIKLKKKKLKGKGFLVPIYYICNLKAMTDKYSSDKDKEISLTSNANITIIRFKLDSKIVTDVTEPR